MRPFFLLTGSSLRRDVGGAQEPRLEEDDDHLR
jgi:hypothetical protein